MKTDIRKLEREEIRDFCIKNDIKSYVSNQVFMWLWQKSCNSFDEMFNISKENRNLFNKNFTINKIIKDYEEKSEDGTIKLRFKLYDENHIEGVLIPQKNRMPACSSSQGGCSLSCKFCATGTLGLKRNITASEIYDQVVLISKKSKEEYGLPLTNIVFMGMGEPLLNYKNVIKALHYITSEEGLNMSYKRVTLSTSGITKMIKKLADDKVKVNLALSLHSVSEETREKIMPVGKSNSLIELRDSLKYYFSKTKKKVTYEYVLLRDINDSLEDAKKLYKFTKHMPSKINLIEYNEVYSLKFQKSTEEKTKIFMNYLEKSGVNVNLRRSRGKDINAACGQLANNN